MARSDKIDTILNQLPDTLAAYDADIIDAEAAINLKGRTLERANMENPTWQSYYDERRVQLKSIVDFLDVEVKRIRGSLFKQLKNNHKLELNTTEMNSFIDASPEYTSIREVQLEVQERLEQYKRVVSALSTQSYNLSNITKIRVASLESTIL